MYKECTTDGEFANRIPWCATKLDKFQNFADFGFCNIKCRPGVSSFQNVNIELNETKTNSSNESDQDLQKLQNKIESLENQIQEMDSMSKIDIIMNKIDNLEDKMVTISKIRNILNEWNSWVVKKIDSKIQPIKENLNKQNAKVSGLCNTVST